MLTPKGLVKNPEALWLGLEKADELGELHKTTRNYAHDAKYAYALKDHIHDLFSEEQARMHYATIRKLIKCGETGLTENTEAGEKEAMTIKTLLQFIENWP